MLVWPVSEKPLMMVCCSTAKIFEANAEESLKWCQPEGLEYNKNTLYMSYGFRYILLSTHCIILLLCVRGGNWQARTLSANQYYQKINVRPRVQENCWKSKIQHSTKLWLRGSGAKILEKHHIHFSHLRSRCVRLSDWPRRTCKLL